MESIRIERLRCLSDTGDVAIKPVTVLLGQNSSGKSTFLRVFPLLKQSVESRTTGPILWNGRLVDFGSYDDAHQRDSTNSISLHFKFQIKRENHRYRLPVFTAAELSEQILHDLDINLTLQIIKDERHEITKTSKIILCFSDSKVIIEFGNRENVSGFYVNSLDVLKPGGTYIFRQSDNKALLPTIYEFPEQKKEITSELEQLSPKLILRKYRYRPFLTLVNILFHRIKKLVHHFTSEKTILAMLFSFSIGNSEAMLNNIQNNKPAGKKWKNHTKNWTIETKEFQEFRDLIIANTVPLILENCDQLLANLSRNVSYMGPARATAERYYRIQDLAVDEVDYQGQNLAMFFRNLTDFEKEEFDKWTLEYFGFKLSIESSLGHISLKIQSEDFNEPVNVADTGFGFSQILPIVTQLWLLSSALPKQERMRAKGGFSPVIFAIEQPELHLHPRLQGILTDAFVKSIKAAKDNDVDLRLIIETHSEVLVNRLGDLVAEGKISSEDINIVLFEPSDEPNKVDVRISEFDSEGYLLNWPLGFFDR